METTFLTQLVGAHFRPQEAKDIIDMLEPGDELNLEREPHNKYDSNAIKVLGFDYDGAEHHLGYIPASEAPEIGQYLMEPERFTYVCEVVDTTTSRKPSLKITITEL